MSNVNPACPNKSDTKPLLNPMFLTCITHHIQDVLHYLASPLQDDETHALQNSNANDTDDTNVAIQQPPESLRLLLIGEEMLLKDLYRLLPQELTLSNSPPPIYKDSNPLNSVDAHSTDKTAIHLTLMSPRDFLQSSFHKRFDLGVNLALTGLENGEIKAYMPEQCSKIATRLRDLFAEQSLIYLPKSTELNLRGLGYVQSTIPDQANSIELNWQAWQFNLYDYKPTPNWLNAKYWANPENFDKYRW